MCEATTIIFGAIALTGAGVSAFSAIQQGQAQADIADQNAELARFAAQDALDRGVVEEERLRGRASVLRGRQRAAIAASGFVLDTGSALDILEDTVRETEFEASTIRANAERQAFGFGIRASQAETQSKAFIRSSQLAAGATILGGAAQTFAFSER